MDKTDYKPTNFKDGLIKPNKEISGIQINLQQASKNSSGLVKLPAAQLVAENDIVPFSHFSLSACRLSLSFQFSSSALSASPLPVVKSKHGLHVSICNISQVLLLLSTGHNVTFFSGL